MTSKTNQTNNGLLSDKAKRNLEQISLDLQTTSKFFKLDPTQSAVLYINPEDKIEKVESERFATADGKPTIRFELKVTREDGTEQLWTTSKTNAIQIVDKLNQGYTRFKVTRIGTGKQTTYLIEGLQK